MNNKSKPTSRNSTKPPATPAGKNPGNAPLPPVQNQDARWQRTVRYTWDKGGSKGGR